MITVLFGGLIFFFLLNVPIAVAIGLASLSTIRGREPSLR